MVKRRDLVEAIKESLKEFQAENGELLERDVHEQAMNFHLAGYLYTELEIGQRDIDLDIEYNKNWDDPKNHGINEEILEEIESQLPKLDIHDESLEMGDVASGQGADIRPDIVLHKRGTHDSNTLVGEIKKYKDSIDKKDVAKVLGLTHPESEYRYRYGVVIPLRQ